MIVYIIKKKYQSVPFNDGKKVRILEEKGNLIKESRNSVKKYIQSTRRKDIKYW